MNRLRAAFGLDKPDLFHSAGELTIEALSRQERRIAYVEKDRSMVEVPSR
jgi:16S rRNA G966 N2-methylase RsmD